jgi:4-diphosphocytidyl-2-C-methyl-D-erythritol kinase
VTLPNTQEVDAPAKVNLSLRVLRRRDDGFHDIDSVVAPISLADRILIHAHADPSQFRTLSLSLRIAGDPELVRPVPSDESNLVLRAAGALAERAGVRGFAEIELEKRVPTAAGLGGGSADAAATLKALNDLWGCGLGLEDLGRVAAAVGSDVPALLAGRTVRIRGRGEVVAPAEPARARFVLVPFDFGVRTADAYRWWDEDGGPAAPGDEWFNDLEPPVLARHPRIEEARAELQRAGLERVILCGSGPTLAGLLSEQASLDLDAAAAIRSVSGRPPLYASTFEAS